jgi:threonine dehydratase
MASDAQQQLDVPTLVLEAVERCQDYLSPTPLEYSRYLSEQIDGEVWLKLDSMQRTFSFKFRGAINKVLTLTEQDLEKGCVAASTGNFAMAIAEAMSIRNQRVTIYVGNDIDSTRLKLLRSHGLDIVVFDGDALGAELEARRVAQETGKIYLSPYNDPVVVGGQGTCGYEISQQLPDVDAVFIACGGGGLLSGTAGWLKSRNPDVQAIGICPANSPAMYEAMRNNKIVEIEALPTLADTCLGNIDPGSVTFEYCQRYVDEFVLVTETEIEASIRLLFEQHRLLAEGSGAMSIGALLNHKERFKGKKVVLVICGRNIDLEVFKRIVA